MCLCCRSNATSQAIAQTVVKVQARLQGLGTPSRYLARTISWNACKSLLLLCLQIMQFGAVICLDCRDSLSPLKSPLPLLVQWLFAAGGFGICSTDWRCPASVFAAHGFGPQLSGQPCTDQAIASKLAASLVSALSQLPAKPKPCE